MYEYNCAMIHVECSLIPRLSLFPHNNCMYDLQHAQTRAHTHAHTYAHTHTYTHPNTHTYTHTHPITNTYTHTHTHTQDLIKYTPPRHADRVTLQLALARCETIAEHLNEAKRSTEQQSIVTHLSSRISDLPFKLTDSPNRLLHTQEAVTRLV